MKWKRKGGVATAEQAGVVYKVKDNGEFSFRLPSGEWKADITESAEDARALCEAHTEVYAAEVAAAQEALRLRQEAAAQLVAIPKRDRQWVRALSALLTEIIRFPHHRVALLSHLPPESPSRQLMEGVTNDTALCDTLRQRTEADLQTYLEQHMLKIMSGEA
jgi:hypothetical protein